MKKDVLIAAAAVVLVPVLCFGIATARGPYAPIESHPVTALDAPAGSGPAPGIPNAKIVMHINGTAVSEQEFNAFLAGAPEQYRSLAATPAGRRMLADNFVKMKLLEQEGRKNGADRDPQAAAQLALDRAQITAGYALQKLVPRPTDAELRAEYEKEKPRLSSMPLSHIVISCGDSPLPSRSGRKLSCEQALAVAQQVEKRLQGGESFSALARAVSDDPNSAAQGGALGNATHGVLPPEIEQAVFALRPNTASHPLQSPYGWHLFMVGQPTVTPFEEAKQSLEQQWRQKRVQEALDRMRSTANVELDPAFFGAEEKGRPSVMQQAPKNPS